MAVFTALALVGPAALAGAQWQLVGTPDGSAPVPRHETGCVEHGGALYLIGGRGPLPVDRLDPLTQTWASLAHPPVELHHAQPVVIDGRVWIAGAFVGDYPNETPPPHVWIYDPTFDAWSVGPTIPAERNRGSAGVVVRDGALYMVGGNTQGHAGGAVPWFDRYDPASDTWTVLPDAPHARDHFTAVVIGNRLFAAGGRRTEQPDPFQNTVGPVDVYDFTAGTWASAPAPLPTERAGTMAMALAEHLVVIGGESPGQVHGEAEALDTATDEWLDLPSLVEPRHSGGGALLDGAAHVVAGAGAPGGSPELGSLERLDLAGLLPPSAANLIVNGDFDAGLDGWSATGGVALAPEGNVAPPSIALASGTALQQFAATAPAAYLLRGVWRASGGAGVVAVTFEALDPSGAVLAQASLVLDTTAANFTSFALDLSAPAGTTALAVQLTASGALLLLVDDLVVLRTPAESPRLGIPANPLALPPTGTGPTIGNLWTPVIDSSALLAAPALDILALGTTPLNVPTPFGTLLVDPLLTLIAASPPAPPFALAVPSDPALIGAKLTAQGAAFDGTTLVLTNALDLTLQAP